MTDNDVFFINIIISIIAIFIIAIIIAIIIYRIIRYIYTNDDLVMLNKYTENGYSYCKISNGDIYRWRSGTEFRPYPLIGCTSCGSFVGKGRNGCYCGMYRQYNVTQKRCSGRFEKQNVSRAILKVFNEEQKREEQLELENAQSRLKSNTYNWTCSRCGAEICSSFKEGKESKLIFYCPECGNKNQILSHTG